MKLPRLITRRRVKWAGVVVAATLIVLAITSETGLSDKYRDWRATDGRGVYMGKGFLCVCLTVSQIPDDTSRIVNAVHRIIDLGLGTASSAGALRSRLLPRLTIGVSYPVIHLPISSIAGISTLIAAYLWRTDRRAKSWQCGKCRYDLRGLEGGVCPECGNRLAIRTQKLN